MMKKNYIKPSMLVEQIDNDIDLLAGSPDPNTDRDADVGQDGTIYYGGNSSGGSGGTRAKGSSLFLTYDDEW